jgi:hypothetical protein
MSIESEHTGGRQLAISDQWLTDLEIQNVICRANPQYSKNLNVGYFGPVPKQI